MARRRRNDYGWGEYRPYVSVAQRRRYAALEAQRARKRGRPLDPVRVAGRSIATTAWGRAWCAHIESFHDYANRLPRGRTYVRNGSIIHLEIRPGEIRAQVIGSELYELGIEIEPCKKVVWKRVRERCAGGIGSLIELLEGRISSEVMAAMTAEKAGLLPDLKQVRMHCSCPDWASLCKHLASVLYGVGARLDERPELLFTLRGVDPAELVDGAARPGHGSGTPPGTRTVEGDLASVFGIDLDPEPPASLATPSSPAPRARKPRAGKRPRPEVGVAVKERSSASTAPARTSGKRKVARRELLEAGVPAGTIGTWLRQGTLLPSEERGVYLHTRESRSRLAQYRNTSS